MSEQPVDLTHELLRQIRAEQVVASRRFDNLESDMLEIKRALGGLTYMIATFTGRLLEDVETRLDRLAP